MQLGRFLLNGHKPGSTSKPRWQRQREQTSTKRKGSMRRTVVMHVRYK